jgi:Rrf2 family protein
MAMVDLAVCQHVAADGAETAVPLSAVADRQHLSTAYLEQLFAKLRRAGLVDSERGRGGGYRLARPAGAISIKMILAAVDEELMLTRCSADEAPCLPGEKCLTHDLWRALSDHIAGFLDRVTLQDVVDGKVGGSWAASAPALFSGGVPAIAGGGR